MNTFAYEVIARQRMNEVREAMMLERCLNRDLPRRHHTVRTIAALLRRLAAILDADQLDHPPTSEGAH